MANNLVNIGNNFSTSKHRRKSTIESVQEVNGGDASVYFRKQRGLKLSSEKTKIFSMYNNELHYLGYVFKHRTN